MISPVRFVRPLADCAHPATGPCFPGKYIVAGMPDTLVSVVLVGTPAAVESGTSTRARWEADQQRAWSNAGSWSSERVSRDGHAPGRIAVWPGRPLYASG